MRRIFGSIRVILRIVLILLFLLITVSYINHRIHLAKEDRLFVANGKMVEVNGHGMHVYTEGQGDFTLVFMSGGGTSSPMLDFKSLYSLLSDKYKIAVVEKAGYGFSDVSDVDRDIDTVLSETREALSKAGVKGPYILLPHSMSGIEALYWAQKYHEEVKGIIGLDMAVPESYKELKINMPFIRLGSFAAKVGITRWIPGLAEGDAVRYGTLTEEDKELYKVIFYRRTATETMIKEVKEIKNSASKVGNSPVPNLPILVFSSNGLGTGWNAEDWRGFQKRFVEKTEKGKIIYLDCSHYVHDIEYKRIAEEVEGFINNLNLR